MILEQWAADWGIPPEAITDLRLRLGETCPAPDVDSPDYGKTEAYSQSLVRLAAPRVGMRLYRNNVGVLKDERGRPVRYGLANDSKALNEQIKSADLIGWRSVSIGPQHVGRTLAVFVSRECKRPGWTFNPNDSHEVAQARWRDMVLAAGGDAAFTTGELE